MNSLALNFEPNNPNAQSANEQISTHSSQSPGESGVPSTSWLTTTKRISESGDQQAFAEFYETFFELMFGTIHKISGGDEATCLDILQEAMLKAIRCMKPMESHTHLTAWCVVVAKSSTYDWLRRQKRQRQLQSSLADAEQKPAKQSTQEPSEIELSEARLQWIEQQLRELPKELQTMISLKYRWGWTLHQIAGRFGLKTGAVDGRIRRAIQKLKARSSEFENQ